LEWRFQDRHRKDKNDPDGHRVRHRVVYIRAEDLASDPLLDNLGELPCEIQVVTLADHIWAELEHDIQYKTPSGSPSDEQKALLGALRSELDPVLRTVEKLMDATEKQRVVNLAIIDSGRDLEEALFHQTEVRFEGDFEKLLVLLTEALPEVSRSDLDKLPLSPVELDRARDKLSEAGLTVGDNAVEVVVAALWDPYGSDFLDTVGSWLGRPGSLKKAVIALNGGRTGTTV
jgi:hypothetical protein